MQKKIMFHFPFSSILFFKKKWGDKAGSTQLSIPERSNGVTLLHLASREQIQVS